MARNYRYKNLIFFFFTFHFLILISCTVPKQISRSAQADLFSANVLKTAHAGISIYEPATKKTWYDYQADKYFVPASNTKIPTLYVAMKYLGDSLEGMRYVSFQNEKKEKTYWLQPTGDPTLLHPDFLNQPVIDFLKKDTAVTYIITTEKQWEDTPWGSGWSWGDYAAYYMAERSQLPVYGNVVWIKGNEKGIAVKPDLFQWKPENNLSDSVFDRSKNNYVFDREMSRNIFIWHKDSGKVNAEEIPFVTSLPLSVSILKNAVPGLKLSISDNTSLINARKIYSQPTDSMLKLLMYRSDNFFAEQCLQMVSLARLGVMSDRKIIDTILKTDFKDLPQPPNWADGSGLSRYNLFSPKDFIFILEKLKNEFGMERLKNIFATGGQGTIRQYYKEDAGFIYGKTGTLSGVVAFSGYLYTKKRKLLIFSTLINNHNGSSADVRKAVEKFLKRIRNKY